MSILTNIATSAPVTKPILTIHGPPGSLKTQFAIDSPNPIILATERGLGNRKAAHYMPTTLADVYEFFRELGTTEHQYQTLAIDTLDHLVPIVERGICERDGKKDLKSYGFGEGYKAEEAEWRDIFKQLEKLRDRKNMAILLLAHSARVDIPDPMTETYSKYEPKTPKKVNAVIKELSDIIGFAHQKVTVRETEDEKRHIAVGRGEFVLELQPQAGFEAKNRYGMKAQIPMSFAAFSAAWKEANP